VIGLGDGRITDDFGSISFWSGAQGRFLTDLQLTLVPSSGTRRRTDAALHDAIRRTANAACEFPARLDEFPVLAKKFPASGGTGNWLQAVESAW